MGRVSRQLHGPEVTDMRHSTKGRTPSGGRDLFLDSAVSGAAKSPWLFIHIS